MPPSINILNLEDDPLDAELIDARLDETGLNYRIHRVQTQDEFKTALIRDKYDIVLSDFTLPAYDGMSALKLTQDLCPDIPFIFVSGTMGEDAVIEGLTKGATDYVLKLGLFRLPSVILRALKEAQNKRERKRITEELVKLSRAVEQSASIIIITDTKGYIEYVNPRFTRVTGYAPDEVLGRHTRILKSGHTSDEEYRHLWENITAGKEWRGEFYNMKKSGEFYWESVSISPVRDTEGRMINFLAVKEDITERKKLEAQLFQAQKMESIGRLAGGIAHDFNNLLGIIMGNTELALGLIADPNQKLHSHLREIHKASDRSADLTRQLLAFARKQTVAPVVLDLNIIIEDMLKIMRRLIGEDIDLIWRPGTKIRPVKMDIAQIDQILVNLCVNARDAILDVGQIIIETGAVTIDELYCAGHPGFVPGDYILLTISDNGHGMEKEILEKIFEPFFTTKEMGKGTGLGLATVYGIIKQNNGFIDVRSRIGLGTTFRIYLPQHKSDTINMKNEKLIETPLEHGETILLVEDEIALLDATQIILEGFGYKVIPASTPEKALEQAGQDIGVIALLITDVVMPQMNGKDLAKQMLAYDPNIKVLFMSSHTSDVIADKGILNPGVNFIQKPFSIDEIALRVWEILKG